MRKFYIENDKGQRYDLQDVNKVILKNPSGLGATYNLTYSEVGAYFVKNSGKKAQQQIVGELLFVGDAYSNYREFGNFMKANSEYKLVYDIDGNEFLIDIDLQTINKGEKNNLNGTLDCLVLFNSKSLYYKRVDQTYQLEASLEGSRWDMVWDFQFTDQTPATLDIVNDGQVPASFDFIIYGSTLNPTVYVYQDGVIINSIDFTIDLQAGEKLLFSNKDDNLLVLLDDGAGNVTNAFYTLDIENDNFFKLPVGSTRLEFNTNVPQLDFTLYKQYEVI